MTSRGRHNETSHPNIFFTVKDENGTSYQLENQTAEEKNLHFTIDLARSNNYSISSNNSQVSEHLNSTITRESTSMEKKKEKSVKTANTMSCPVGFIKHKDSCYHIIGSSGVTWPIANTYCQLHGSKLVEIETESEQEFIEDMIKAAKGKCTPFKFMTYNWKTRE